MTAASAQHGADYRDAMTALYALVDELFAQGEKVELIRVQARTLARKLVPPIDAEMCDKKVYEIGKRYSRNGHPFIPAPITAAEILRTDYAPMRWTIDDILPEGLILLAARPKIGKSWLALQIALGVANGANVLNRRTPKGQALYLALEDNARRLQQRLFKYRAGYWSDQTALTRVEFATVWARADEGGIDALAKWLEAHPDARLIVIDTLERFRAKRTDRGNTYAEDYAALQTIRTLCESRQITVLIVHHTRKAAAEDPIDAISGTLGLGGAADGALVLVRQRGAEQAELHLIGRDIAGEGAYAVRFDRASCMWEMEGRASEVAKTRERQEILDLLKREARPMPPREIASELGRKGPTVRRFLQGLIDEGKVYRAANGAYSLSLNE